MLTAIIGTVTIASVGLFLNIASNFCLGDGPDNAEHCNKIPELSIFYIAAFGPAIVTAIVGVYSVTKLRTLPLVAVIVTMLITAIVFPAFLWTNWVCHNGCA